MTIFPISCIESHWSSDLARDMRRNGIMFAVVGVPWDMIAEHEAQCLRNHGQTLEHLARRGGITAQEACAVLADRFSVPSLLGWQAHAKLAHLMAEWIARQEKPDL